MSTLTAITANALTSPAIGHGFFTRLGGASGGVYQGLNCGPGSADNPRDVATNRSRVRRHLGADHLLSLYQVHGRDVVTVKEPWEQGAAPKADGMVSDVPGLALGILTADCVPVLFADTQARVIGTAHAGWKGAVAGVIDSTVDAMIALGAARHRIAAVVGPAIAQVSYEVGDDVRTAVLGVAGDAANRFVAGNAAGKFQFDLKGFVGDRLLDAGLGQVSIRPEDTYGDADRFYSYRRGTHLAEADYGRLISTIMLRQGTI